MDDREQLIERLREAARRVFDGTPVFLAYAHGSRIGGRPRPDSDLDVAYYAGGYPHGQALPWGQELGLAARLSDEMRLNVDLRRLNGAPLEVRGRLLERGVRIYCSDEVGRVNLERDLLCRWHDCKEQVDRMHVLRLRQYARRGFTRGG